MDIETLIRMFCYWLLLTPAIAAVLAFIPRGSGRGLQRRLVDAGVAFFCALFLCGLGLAGLWAG